MTAYEMSTAKKERQLADYPYSPWDLREWLQHVEEMGELRRVTGADRDVDLGPLSQSVEQLPNGGPALLFDEIHGFPKGFRILTNANNTMARFGYTCGLEECTSINQAVMHWRSLLKKLTRVPIVPVDNGPVLDNILEGSDIDLELFPTPKWHHHDGGRYIGTGGVVITRDPADGELNFGTYRMMVAAKDRITGLIAHGKHGDLHRRKYFEKNQPCPAVISCGHHPIYLVAGASLPHPYHGNNR